MNLYINRRKNVPKIIGKCAKTKFRFIIYYV